MKCSGLIRHPSRPVSRAPQDEVHLISPHAEVQRNSDASKHPEFGVQP